ncbi:MAG: hypothetical protein JWP88_2168 [Flaviaesturariibacter sp.]|nr:hypothetical protein [Flaviaesturariibacter sp.]
MLLALAWLTISLPFVYDFQQSQKASAHKQSVQTTADNEEESNPLSNTAEEKSEGGVTQLSEYLHNHELELHAFTVLPPCHIGHQCNLHLDVHPEFFSPPPEVINA